MNWYQWTLLALIFGFIAWVGQRGLAKNLKNKSKTDQIFYRSTLLLIYTAIIVTVIKYFTK